MFENKEREIFILFIILIKYELLFYCHINNIIIHNIFGQVGQHYKKT